MLAVPSLPAPTTRRLLPRGDPGATLRLEPQALPVAKRHHHQSFPQAYPLQRPASVTVARIPDVHRRQHNTSKPAIPHEDARYRKHLFKTHISEHRATSNPMPTDRQPEFDALSDAAFDSQGDATANTHYHVDALCTTCQTSNNGKPKRLDHTITTIAFTIALMR